MVNRPITASTVFSCSSRVFPAISSHASVPLRFGSSVGGGVWEMVGTVAGGSWIAGSLRDSPAKSGTATYVGLKGAVVAGGMLGATGFSGCARAGWLTGGDVSVVLGEGWKATRGVCAAGRAVDESCAASGGLSKSGQTERR